MSNSSSRKRASCQNGGRGGSSKTAGGTGGGGGGGSSSGGDDEIGEKRASSESKKTNLSSTSDETAASQRSPVLREALYLKVLIPGSAAGAIIGKGGETIGDLQKQTGTRIKMSKSNDFYPGTNDRVCLISGTAEGILNILDFVSEKIRDKPDPTTTVRPSSNDHDKASSSSEREKQVKLLIPNSTAGMIIGKAGAFIKQIKDESGAFIQLSQKSKDTTLSERVVTVIGEPESNRAALEMILEKVEEDPQSGTCLNISYSDVQGLVANSNPTGSPYANGHQQHADMDTSSRNSDVSSPTNNNPFVLPLATGGALNLKFNMNPNRPPTDPALMGQYLGYIGSSLRGCGYSDHASEEVAQSLRVLANHGIIVINLTGSGVPQRQSQQHPQQQHLHLGQPPPTGFIRGQVLPYHHHQHHQQDPTQSFIPPNSYSRYWSSASGDPSMSDPSFGRHRAPSPPVQPVNSPRGGHHLFTNNQNSFGLGPNTGSSAMSVPPPPPPQPHHQQQMSEEHMEREEIEISENIIGAVIGPSGRSIVDIQQASGARVKISKKGTFSPGTRNRIVTIAGSLEAIASAKCLIDRKILEEESKRERSTVTY